MIFKIKMQNVKYISIKCFIDSSRYYAFSLLCFRFCLFWIYLFRCVLFFNCFLYTIDVLQYSFFIHIFLCLCNDLAFAVTGVIHFVCVCTICIVLYARRGIHLKFLLPFHLPHICLMHVDCIHTMSFFMLLSHQKFTIETILSDTLRAEIAVDILSLCKEFCRRFLVSIWILAKEKTNITSQRFLFF